MTTQLQAVTTAWELAFTVYDEPLPMPRPRAAVIGGKARVYMPTKLHEAERRIREAALATLPATMPALPFEGAVALQIRAFLSAPKTIPRYQFGRKRHTTRPDADHLAALLFDALGGYVYRNDSQVVSVCIEKLYAWSGVPRWEVLVKPA